MDSLYAAAEKKQHMTRECDRQESGGGGKSAEVLCKTWGDSECGKETQ